MKTGIAYGQSNRSWATVEMIHAWRKVTFISGPFKNRTVFIFGGYNPEVVAQLAYDGLQL